MRLEARRRAARSRRAAPPRPAGGRRGPCAAGPHPAHDADDAPATLSDTSYEVELDDDPDAAPGAVDDGIGFVLDDDPDAYPVIPEHLRSLAGVGGALARHGRRLGHRGAFHGVRSPLYLILALWWAVVGVFRLAGRQVSWWWVAETDLLRSAAVANRDAREWMRLHREAKETRLIRGIVLAAEVAALAVGCVVLAAVP